VPPPEPTDWVYSWLAAGEQQESSESGDIDCSNADTTSVKGLASTAGPLRRYGKSFVAAGLSSLEDVAVPPLFDDELLTAIGISSVGHRRAIIRMHAALLLQQETKK
jgi:hypothetical protein